MQKNFVINKNNPKSQRGIDDNHNIICYPVITERQGGIFMYDVCDVLNASYCSADVANHVLRVYGEGSMGKGMRKLAGEMLTIGGQQSYTLGYEAGVTDTYPMAFKNGAITSSAFCICVVGLIGLGVWGVKKLKMQHEAEKETASLHSESAEGVYTHIEE